jgi:hypothetical protein
MRLAGIFSTTLCAAIALGVVSMRIPAHADNDDLDFILANKTGQGIREIYIAPSASMEWGNNLIVQPMKEGDQLAILFGAAAKAELWDIHIVWIDEGSSVTWKSCKLSDISKITLYYNRDTDETSAETE